MQVHEDMMEDEPDWEVKPPSHSALPMQQARMQQSPRQPYVSGSTCLAHTLSIIWGVDTVWMQLTLSLFFRRSDSVQSREYQVGILRTHLQQRLGDNALDNLLDCLKSETLDDDTKAAQVEHLIRSQHEILPIVHTLIYLEQRL